MGFLADEPRALPWAGMNQAFGVGAARPAPRATVRSRSGRGIYGLLLACCAPVARVMLRRSYDGVTTGLRRGYEGNQAKSTPRCGLLTVSATRGRSLDPPPLVRQASGPGGRHRGNSRQRNSPRALRT